MIKVSLTNMNNANTLSEDFEIEDPAIEAFMPIERMGRMTEAALFNSGRIDEEGYVQPIEVKRNLHGGQWLVGPVTDSEWRTDIFIPTAEETKRYIATDEHGLETKNRIVPPKLDQALYDALTGKEMVSLTHEQAVEVHHDKAALEATIANDPAYNLWYSEEQLKDAYHINAVEKTEPDFAPTRVYVPAGVDGLKVANAVFASGADVAYAKIWTPQVATGKQYVRQDTPIFEVETFDQLTSLMASLRQLSRNGEIPSSASSMAGYEVEDLPGVYIGQTHNGESFNSRMRELFGTSIQEACAQVKLHAGDIVDDHSLDTIAKEARRLAQAKADETDTDPYNHAFLANQPVAAILAAVNQDT